MNIKLLATTLFLVIMLTVDTGRCWGRRRRRRRRCVTFHGHYVTYLKKYRAKSIQHTKLKAQFYRLINFMKKTAAKISSLGRQTATISNRISSQIVQWKRYGDDEWADPITDNAIPDIFEKRQEEIPTSEEYYHDIIEEDEEPQQEVRVDVQNEETEKASKVEE